LPNKQRKEGAQIRARLERLGVYRESGHDRDNEGEHGAATVAQKLMAEGIGCYRIPFPKGMDANEYAPKVTPAAKSLGVLIRKAEWLGDGGASPSDALPSSPTTAVNNPLSASSMEMEPLEPVPGRRRG